MNGADILIKAKAHLGEKYVLGAHAPLQNAKWQGPWDCAEYCSWLTYQTFGIIYGCGTTTLEGADPYSGFWADDANSRGVKVSVAQAAATPGAFLIRLPVTKPQKLIGHVAIAIGDGQVYEAAGAQLGVRIGPIAGRRWDMGVLLPGVDYGNAPAPAPGVAPPGGTSLPLILRQQATPAFDDHVVELQAALQSRNFDPGHIDGQFGPATQAAVYGFQIAEGLVPDGEVGPQTGAALALPFWPAVAPGAAGQAPAPAPVVLLTSDAFGTVVNTSTSYTDIRNEYVQMFANCTVQDKNGEIAELCGRIADNRDRYKAFVAGYQGQTNQDMPWFFVAVAHAMEASGDVGRFKTHLHNGDPLTKPTVHVPKGRPNPNGTNFTWEESAKDAIALEHLDTEGDWSLPRMLYRLERYNGMGPRRKGHATAYLWSYSNHYIKGKYIADNLWSDDAVSKQPGAAAILKFLVDKGTVTIP
jgi:lysozyme family protein